MCHRLSPLTTLEAQEAIRALREEGRARLPRREAGASVPDAYPGSQVPLFVVGPDGQLQAQELAWGLARPKGGSGLVFNTRLDTALSQAADGRGMWAGPIREGRCLVPARGFFENWTVGDGGASLPDAARPGEDALPGLPPAAGGRPRRRQVCFRLEGWPVFLIAAVRAGDRFSVVTTSPNAAVAPVHTRMPLVLGPGESATWLGPDYASLADRSGIRLTSQVEG